jgi:SAM-dependent methyltransferase
VAVSVTDPSSSGVHSSYELHTLAERKEAESREFPSVVTAPQSIDNLRHLRMIDSLGGLLAGLYHRSTWLTVGDGHYGADAIRLLRYDIQVHASSLTDATLRESQSKGWITDASAQNAEALDFADSTFDFVLCKEAYHHFPRPAIAFYEMLRVARTAVILIEPQRRHVSPLGFLRDAFKRLTGRAVEAAYEPCGNYIFRLCIDEVSEMARACDLPVVAYRGHNDFYHPRLFRKPVASVGEKAIFWSGILLQNLLCRLRLMPYGGVSCAVFKQEPPRQVVASLRARGVHVMALPRNPYLAAR